VGIHLPDYSDEQLREFQTEALRDERGANNLLSRQIHRKRRLAADREIRRRGLA
jgi:hypothetical protein